MATTRNVLIFIYVWREATNDEPARPATSEEIDQHVRLVHHHDRTQLYVVCDTGYSLETPK